jgi:hypothetical protein
VLPLLWVTTGLLLPPPEPAWLPLLWVTTGAASGLAGSEDVELAAVVTGLEAEEAPDPVEEDPVVGVGAPAAATYPVVPPIGGCFGLACLVT